MKDWCLSHPYLTFTLALVLIGSCTSFAEKLIDLFKKKQPAVIGFKVISQPEQSKHTEYNSVDPESLN